MDAIYKKCGGVNGCGESFPATEEYFYKQGGGRGRFRKRCKRCMRKTSLVYRSNHKEEMKKQSAKYRVKNAVKLKQRRAQNSDKKKEYDAEYRIQNAERIAEYQKEYRLKNLDKLKEYMVEYYEQNYEEIVEHQTKLYSENVLLCLEKLGHRCQWDECGITNAEFLSFDHINNDGAKHRKEIGSGGKGIIAWLIKNNFPKDRIQLLCHNHNWLKELARRRSLWLQTPKAIYGRKSKAKLRLEVFTKYGLECACCGEANFDLLTIDHENGGGGKHRKEIGVVSGNPFYLWLKNSGFPSGYRTLCTNCNKARGAHKYCPHEKGINTWQL